MQIFTITKGATSVILPVSLFDSSSTTGAKLPGLAFNSAGLTAFYNRSGAAGAAVAITLATATKGTWATGGFVAIDGTNMPGDYELHVPDAVLATGANTVLIQLKGAANMVPKNIQINLTSADLQNSTTLGLTNLDAAVSSRMATYTQPTGFLAATFPATVSSPTNITAATGIVLSGVTHTGAVIPTVNNLTNLPAIPANWLTAAGIAASAMNGKGDWNIGKTGYSLTQAFPANFAVLSISAAGLVDILQAAADKVWGSTTRTLSAFSTALAVSVWDVLETAITTASTIGLKLKNNVDVLTSSRMATYTQPTGFLAAVFPATVSSSAEVAAVQSDTDNIQTRIPAALVAGRIDASVGAMATDVITTAAVAAAALNGKGDWNIGKTGYALSQAFPANFPVLAIAVTTGRVTANTDQINGSAASANRLQRSTAAIAFGTVGVGSSTTSIITSAMDPAAAAIDQFKDKVISFASDTTTVNLRSQSQSITSNTAAGVLTVPALTTAPVSGDTFVIT